MYFGTFQHGIVLYICQLLVLVVSPTTRVSARIVSGFGTTRKSHCSLLQLSNEMMIHSCDKSDVHRSSFPNLTFPLLSIS